MIKFKEFFGESAGQMDMKRTALFLVFVAVAGAMFYGPFREMMRVALRSDYYSHIVLIPFVSAYLLFVRRKEIFADIEYAFVPGAAVAAVGVLLYGLARMVPMGLNKNDLAALVTLAALFFVVGAFILLFGLQAFRAGPVRAALSALHGARAHGPDGRDRPHPAGRVDGVCRAALFDHARPGAARGNSSSTCPTSASRWPPSAAASARAWRW